MHLKTADLEHAITTVQRLANECGNVRSELSGNYSDAWGSYLDWAYQCERQLRNIFAEADIAEAVYTERYWRIATKAAIAREAMLIGAEIDVQVERLKSLACKLQGYLPLRERPGAIVVPDTNVLLHFQRVDYVPWSKVTGDSPVRLVIPLVVLDELDDKRYLGRNDVAAKARSATVPLDERQQELEEHGYASLPDSTTLEYLLDDPRHRRQANPDDEILDRSAFLHQVTNQPVTIITGDRGMRVRARARSNGLTARLMPAKFSRNQEEANQSPTD